jgi:hypothetical protein
VAELLNLFPKVFAQTVADAISQPTFGTIEVAGGGSQTSSILLTSTATSTEVGQRFKVTVSIETNAVTINNFRLIIDFDPTKPGTQIRNLDTIFVPSNPQTDNSVSNTGRITYIANTTDGNATSLNREVVEIEFQAQATGATPIRIVTGSSGAQLIRQTGAGVNFTSNEVNIQIAPSTQSNGNGNPNPNPTPNPPPTDNTGGGNGTVTPPPTLPDTAFGDSPTDFAMLGIGALIVLIGIKLSLFHKNKDVTTENDFE